MWAFPLIDLDSEKINKLKQDDSLHTSPKQRRMNNAILKIALYEKNVERHSKSQMGGLQAFIRWIS